MSLQDEKWGEREMKAKKDKNDYSDQTIKNRRKFPVKNTIIIAICIVAQIFLIYLAITAKAEPQDIIEKYTVTVEPLEDGSLDIEYSFLWKAIDVTEELTWVEIGMPNAMFTVYDDSVSGNIKEYFEINNDGYTAVRLDFQRGYKGGEIASNLAVNSAKKYIENNFSTINKEKENILNLIKNATFCFICVSKYCNIALTKATFLCFLFHLTNF